MEDVARTFGADQPEHTVLVTTECEAKLNVRAAGVADVVHIADDYISCRDLLQVFSGQMPPELLPERW